MILAGALAASPARAADPAELTFWQTVLQSGQPDAYQAYLDQYPDGTFAALARRRAAARPSPAAAAPTLSLERDDVALVQGIVVDVDASPLREGSNHRLVVAPAGSPDEPADPQAFADDSTPVPTRLVHLTIPAGPPGRDEVRLLYIPPFASAYRVGARVPVTVQPGAPGAVLARDLVREAERLGPLRFQANHRDQRMLVQAAFLRVRPETEWNAAWVQASLRETATRLMVISIGQPGAIADAAGATGELICVLPADDATVDHVAGLRVGDPVLVSGVPLFWASSVGPDPLALNRCALQH